MPNDTRTFETGATRDTDAGKLDFEGFLSPLTLDMYARYMDKKRQMPDGSRRASDNWQQGIPLDAYMKSAFRHFMDLWRFHRGLPTEEPIEDALCGLFFNIHGYMHEHSKRRPPEPKRMVPRPLDPDRFPLPSPPPPWPHNVKGYSYSNGELTELERLHNPGDPGDEQPPMRQATDKFFITQDGTILKNGVPEATSSKE